MAKFTSDEHRKRMRAILARGSVGRRTTIPTPGENGQRRFRIPKFIPRRTRGI